MTVMMRFHGCHGVLPERWRRRLALRGYPPSKRRSHRGIVFLTHGDGVDTYASDTSRSATRPPAVRRSRGATYEKGDSMFRQSLALLGLMVVSSAAAPAEAQWTQFRGPNAGDVGDDPALPDTWSETENVVWSVDIPGLSWSSPVVWEDTIFCDLCHQRRSGAGSHSWAV